MLNTQYYTNLRVWCVQEKEDLVWVELLPLLQLIVFLSEIIPPGVNNWGPER